ncbi:MAG: agmatinase [Candidatus Taylorbacteria bacterium]|nr:agmatinase [Candidatus Taylorbacteria bacterium]
MIDSIINCKNIKEADVIVLSAGYGQSFTYRGGAENGPSEIVKCLHGNLEFFDRFTMNEPIQFLKIYHHELKNINNVSSEEMVKQISDFNLKYKDKFIIMLGGSHSVSNGAFSYFEKYKDPTNITILQIDAHPDLRENTFDFKDTSDKFDHACVMRRACEMSFQTVQVGIRTYSIYERKFIVKNNLKIFEWGKKKIPSINEIIKSIKTKDVYLTLDVDGLDPSHTPATGTPVPGGLEWTYTQRLLRKLILSKNLIGADIVEVSPFKHDVLTQYAAANLCYNIMSYKIMKDKKMLTFFE